MVRREVPLPIKRSNFERTPGTEKTENTCSKIDYIMRDIFMGSHHSKCKVFEDEDPKKEILEKVKEIFKYLSVQELELIEKLSLEEVTLRLEELSHESEKLRFGRKLLSIEQCSGDECETDEELVTEGTDTESESEDDYEADEEDDEETEEESDDNQHHDLLNEDSLEELLNGVDFGRKLQHINNLLDKFEIIVNSAREDEDLYISSIQSLLVYVSAIEDLKAEESPSMENADTLEALTQRLKSLQMKYLSQITHFDTFFNRALESFEELLEKNQFDRKNKDDVKVLNDFIFNFHYALEIEAIIKRRDIEDELMIISDLKEDMKVMKNAYESLGYGEEVQNDEYFSRILEDIEDEDIYQSRRLLSISEMSTDQTCNAKDNDCIHAEDKNGPSADNYDRCQHLLEKAEKMRDQMSFKEKYFLSLQAYNQKLQYVRTFMKGLKNSQNILNEYQDIMVESKNCQEYVDIMSRMKKIIEIIQSQAGNLDWLKHVSSFLFEMKSSEDLLELSEILKEYDELDMGMIMGERDTMDTNVKKRSLLSIETCEKDDLNCRQKDSKESELVRNLKKSNHNVKGKNKEKSLRRLKHELDEAYEKAGGNKGNEKTPALVQCQQFLLKSKKDLKALSNLESKTDTLKILEPKKKIKLIRSFMSLMTNVKSLFDEYKVLSSSLTENDDKVVCQPVMKEAFDNLLKLQKISSKVNWFNEMNSLLSTEDPEVVNELTDIMQKFKMN